MPDPGEFYSLIGAGPYRGIPALYLVESNEMANEALLPDIVTKFCDLVGFRAGKSFIYLSRAVNPLFVKTLRELGFYVVADVEVGNKYPWITEANHVMLGSTGTDFVGGSLDSFVYIANEGATLREPEFMPEVEQVPKFLYVPGVDSNVLSFLQTTKYPWSVQIASKLPFKVEIKL